jgi:hypothetical protein
MKTSHETRAIVISKSEKKADVVEHRFVFDHVGILVNGPLGTAGAPFI